MEPCSGGKAAVLTVLMRLPSGPSGLPPPGQSGNYKTVMRVMWKRLHLQGSMSNENLHFVFHFIFIFVSCIHQTLH